MPILFLEPSKKSIHLRIFHRNPCHCNKNNDRAPGYAPYVRAYNEYVS